MVINVGDIVKLKNFAEIEDLEAINANGFNSDMIKASNQFCKIHSMHSSDSIYLRCEDKQYCSNIDIWTWDINCIDYVVSEHNIEFSVGNLYE